MNFISTEILNNILTQSLNYILNISLILIILTVVKKIGLKIIRKLFTLKIGTLKRTTTESLKQKETIKQLFLNLFKYLINMIGLLVIISIFIPIGTLMTSVGAVALVISFAFQSMFADIVRGFFIIFEEMFLVGDYVDVAGFQGEVIEIGLRITKLRLIETSEIVLIPNSNIGNIVRLDINRINESK
jgi:small conductance mechanosensitive channel